MELSSWVKLHDGTRLGFQDQAACMTFLPSSEVTQHHLFYVLLVKAVPKSSQLNRLHHWLGEKPRLCYRKSMLNSRFCCDYSWTRQLVKCSTRKKILHQCSLLAIKAHLCFCEQLRILVGFALALSHNIWHHLVFSEVLQEFGG